MRKRTRKDFIITNHVHEERQRDSLLDLATNHYLCRRVPSTHGFIDQSESTMMLASSLHYLTSGRAWLAGPLGKDPGRALVHPGRWVIRWLSQLMLFACRN